MRSAIRSLGFTASIAVWAWLAAVPGSVDAVERPHAAGLAVGVPQTIAIEYEYTLSRNLELCAHAGTAVLFSSAGARIRWGSTAPGFRLALFAGGAAIHSFAEDAGNPEGWAGYAWLGPSILYRSRAWKLFAEICLLAGGPDDAGLGEDVWVFPFEPAIAGGITVRF